MSTRKMIIATVMTIWLLMYATVWGVVRSDKGISEQDDSRPIYVPGEIIIGFESGVSVNSVNAITRSKGGSVKRKLRLRNRNVHLLKVPSWMDELEFIREMEKNPKVIYAERNGYVYALDQWVPDDPNYPQQWALNNIGQPYPIPKGETASGTSDADIDAPEGWDDVNDIFGRIGDSNIVIAILDTGVDANHPDLSDAIGAGDFAGYDFINNDNDPHDDHGHGTHCAGIAAAVTDNDECVAGLAGGCTIMPIKVLGANGSGTHAQVAAGIDYAADPNHQADVISMSLGGWLFSQTIADSVSDANATGCVVVASAGNTGDSAPQYPAALPECITVSATDSDDELVWFSSIGSHIDVAAPGVDILSLRGAGTDIYEGKQGYTPGDNFVPYGDENAKMYICSGTSMSCPHVAGLAALLRSVDPNLTPREVRYLIRNGSDDLGNKGGDWYYGAGRINVYESVYGAINGLSKATDPLPENDANDLNLQVDLYWNAAAAALSHDVYFGTSFNDVNDANTSSDEFIGNQVDNLFWLDTLEPNTTYYWRIDEKGSSSTIKGDVWSFTTDSDLGIFYVDTDADPNGDGGSWSNAFDNLQDALEAVTWSGEEIWVAEGTYKPTGGSDRLATFQLVNGTKLYGGFDGTETALNQRDWLNNETILSGDIGTPNDVDDNCYNVVTGVWHSSTVIDGFTITNGNAYNCGGGMRIHGSITVSNCVFSENKADAGGGGLACMSGSPTITNCVFSNNSAGGVGGGLYSSDASVTVNNCCFSENEVVFDGQGGGMCSLSWTEGFGSMLTNCTFVRNTARFGAAFSCYNTEITVSNCTFAKNAAEYYGGGMYLVNNKSGDVNNCIFWGNSAIEDSNEIHLKWPGEATATFSYCDIQDCNGSGPDWYDDIGVDGGGNIDQDPLFVDVDADDFHLDLSSPCINAGDPNGDYNGQTDIDGDERVIMGRVDMGSDEACRVHNITQNTWFNYIQDAINYANNDDIIEAYEDTYDEAVDFNGVGCTLRSTNPNKWDVVEATIINGNDATIVVEFSSGEDANSILEGFTITGGDYGIVCYSSPVIRNCIIENNSSYC